MCLTQIYTARAGIHEYMSNRVEDLERQVAELQAAVNGLTEELVEMKERVRQVEDAQEVAVETDTEDAASDAPADVDETSDTPANATGDASRGGGEHRTHSDDHVEVVERTDSPAESADEPTSEATADAGDDVVVPERGATTPDAEAASSEADGDEANEDESDDSDIIVA